MIAKLFCLLFYGNMRSLLSRVIYGLFCRGIDGEIRKLSRHGVRSGIEKKVHERATHSEDWSTRSEWAIYMDAPLQLLLVPQKARLTRFISFENLSVIMHTKSLTVHRKTTRLRNSSHPESEDNQIA